MKFQIGDTVKVVADKERLEMIGVFNKTICDFEGKVKSTDGDILEYEIYFPKISAYYYLDEQDLELVPVEGGAETKQEVQKLFGHPRFYEILEDMGELHSKKNHDYAGTSDPLKNLRACTRLDLEPFMGVMVRLQDKWSRLEEFVKSGKLMVKGESVKDTLMDNAVYSILAIILYEEQEKVKHPAPMVVDGEVCH